MSYTKDREARRRRLKARGIEVGTPPPIVSASTQAKRCQRCGGCREVVVQGRGLVPCPDCSGAA